MICILYNVAYNVVKKVDIQDCFTSLLLGTQYISYWKKMRCLLYEMEFAIFLKFSLVLAFLVFFQYKTISGKAISIFIGHNSKEQVQQEE